MTIAVVILNWNGEQLLKLFLPSVVEKSGRVAQVVVADNGSTDQSVQYIKANFSQVKIISLTENKGFTGGYNEALKQISADIFVLLNSDVEVTENWIEPVIRLMEKDALIAVCQPKIKSFNKKNEFEYAGAAGGFIDKYGYPFCRGRIFETIEKDEEQYNSSIETFWASGACMFVRSDVFNKLGGFDESFFAHMEEIDFCWRVKRSGFKVMCCPQSEVYHLGGGTLKTNSPRKTYLNFRNNLLMLHKNLPPEKIWSIVLTRLILDGMAGFRFIFTNNLSHCWAVIKAHFYFYSHLSQRNKIRKLNSKLSYKTEKGIFRNSLVWKYYFQNRKKYSDIIKKEI